MDLVKYFKIRVDELQPGDDLNVREKQKKKGSKMTPTPTFRYKQLGRK